MNVDLACPATHMPEVPCPVCGYDQSQMVEIRETDLRWLLALVTGHPAADPEFLERMHAIRIGRRTAGLHPQDTRVVNHLDGNPRNIDPSNLVIADPKENGDA